LHAPNAISIALSLFIVGVPIGVGGEVQAEAEHRKRRKTETSRDFMSIILTGFADLGNDKVQEKVECPRDC
jgi:hypothetical protein